MQNWPKKHPWLSIAIVTAAWFALLFFGSLFIGAVRDICSKNEYTGAKECTGHHLGPWTVFWIAEFIDAHNGVVAAFAGITVAWFTYTLWKTSTDQAKLTRQSIEDARKSSERELRAYIAVTVKLSEFSLKEPIQMLVVFENIGQTPARHVACHSNISVLKLPLDDDTTMPVPHETPIGRKSQTAPLFPTCGNHFPTAHQRALSAEEIKWLTEPKPETAIYVYGAIQYEDVFAKARDTSYCLYIDPDGTKNLIAASRSGNINKEMIEGTTMTLSHVLNDFT